MTKPGKITLDLNDEEAVDEQRKKCVAKLKEGIPAWNAWRKQNPGEPIILSQIDFKTTFFGSAVWGEFAVLEEAEDADTSDDQDDAIPPHDYQDDDSAPATSAAGKKQVGVKISEINLRKADLRLSRLIDVRIRRADLRDANFSRAKLNGARLSNSLITGANFERATLKEARFRGVHYTRQGLTGKCWGIRSAETISGNASFRRDVIDQDYLDALHHDIIAARPGRLSPYIRSAIERGDDEKPSPLENIIAWPMAYLRCIASETSVAVAVLGMLIAAIVGPAADQGIGYLLTKPGYIGLAIGAITGIGIGAFFKSWYGQIAGFFLWRMLDYGRDWDRVVMVAALLIGFYGAAYHLMSPDHIRLHVGTDGTPVGVGEHWFYPWFVAAMGFATLGIADVARPLTGLGQLVMITNVLAGFTTFGLLLAVLGNVFARRA